MWYLYLTYYDCKREREREREREGGREKFYLNEFHFQILMSASSAMVVVLNFVIILKEATIVTVSKDLTWK